MENQRGNKYSSSHSEGIINFAHERVAEGPKYHLVDVHNKLV